MRRERLEREPDDEGAQDEQRDLVGVLGDLELDAGQARQREHDPLHGPRADERDDEEVGAAVPQRPRGRSSGRGAAGRVTPASTGTTAHSAPMPSMKRTSSPVVNPPSASTPKKNVVSATKPADASSTPITAIAITSAVEGGSASPPVLLTAAMPSASPASGNSSDAEPRIARRYALSASTRPSSGERRATATGIAAAR